MSGVANAKFLQNYQAATQRPACRNCRHSEEQSDGLGARNSERAGWRCKLGAFFVTAFAVCARHERKPGSQLAAVDSSSEVAR